MKINATFFSFSIIYAKKSYFSSTLLARFNNSESEQNISKVSKQSNSALHLESKPIKSARSKIAELLFPSLQIR